MATTNEHAFRVVHGRLIETLRRNGITDERVLESMLNIPRHLFVPASLVRNAYSDIPLPIGKGQTISQPWVVARMTELILERSPLKVLEVGTGSGYQAAVLAGLVREVVSLERIECLAQRARQTWQKIDLQNIKSFHLDGRLGCAGEAPFDAILVTAGSAEVPDALYSQLAEGGRLVMPVGHPLQRILVSDREQGEHRTFVREAVRFVPLLPGTE